LDGSLHREARLLQLLLPVKKASRFDVDREVYMRASA